MLIVTYFDEQEYLFTTASNDMMHETDLHILDQ